MDDFIDGTSEPDTLEGFDGNDTINGLAGDDVLMGNGGDDVLDGGDDNDSLDGGAGNDSLMGGSGADALLGGAGDDTLEGGAGADSLNGGADIDTLVYINSFAGVNIDIGNNIVSGGDAQGDAISGFENAVGSAHADTIYGGAADNNLTGNGGDDVLMGAGGDDTIEGGLGADTAVYSGASGDYTIIAEGGGVFTIMDNNAADGDDGVDTLTGVETVMFNNASMDLNTPVEAQDDSFVIGESGLVNGDLFADNGNGADSDFDNDPFSVTAVNGAAMNVGGQITLASGALLTVNGDGTFSYDTNGEFEWLAAGATAFDSFTYTIDDGVGGPDTATVSIEINGENDAPVARNDNFATDEAHLVSGDLFADNGSGPDSDADAGDVFTITSVNGSAGSVGTQITLASGALLTVNANGTYEYDPNGAYDSLEDGENGLEIFTYGVADGNGGEDTAIVTVSIDGIDDVALFGTPAPDTLTAGAGADTVWGAEDNDLLEGLGGNDFMSGEEGADRLFGADGNDTLSGGFGNDTIDGGAGRDSLTGESGRDVIIGRDGNDLLHGFGSHDSLYGGDGDDDLRGGHGRDLLGGSGGNDIARGFDGDDRLFGGGGSDTLLGNDGNDSLTGGGGVDRLKGDAGDDTLNGRFGDDWVTGGEGDDLFEFRKGHGNDIYDDFTAGAGSEDVIQLLVFGTAFDTFAEVMAASNQNGADVIIDFGGGDTITLVNTNLGELHEDDFIFG
ncbi:Ig-like domain-containing protein [Hyphococcus sp.]|uniref:Ig-like domain-containing protein n=1 Tax=Hyphococcus sp. TaxID=2038636 RepID=UPI003CCC1A18